MRFAAVRTAGRSVRGLHITAITAAVRTQSLPAPFVTAARRVDALTEAVITVETDEGFSGCCGVPDLAAVTGDTPGSAVYAAERIFAPLLVGCELTADAAERCGKALYGNPGAKAALDVAVHCALAASRKAPLCELLGGEMRELTTDLTVSAGRPADVAANAADAYARGFSILKIKLGTDIGADLQTLRELKAALPPDACLRLDANQGWTAAEALRAAELCTALGLNVDFLEQPTPCADLRALAEVTRGTELRVLADESARDLESVRRIIETGSADMVSIKLFKCGGLRRAREIADCCASQGVGVVMSCMLEGAEGTAAAAHFAAAAGIDRLDLDAPLLCGRTRAGDVVFDGCRIRFLRERAE